MFTAEEKCLPRNDRDIESNWGLTKHLWYDKVNLTESNAPHILGEDATELGEEADLCAQLGAEHYLELLKSQNVSILPRRGDSAAPPELWLPQFDLVLLSVQEDGSVAGLFPGHPILEDETGAWVHPLWDAPTGPKGRVTLSLDVLSNAKQLWLVASGAEKEAVVGDAFAGLNPTVRRPTFETKAIPATLIGGSPRWLVDVFAIAKLPSNAPRADGCARRRLEHGEGSSTSPSSVSDQVQSSLFQISPSQFCRVSPQCESRLDEPSLTSTRSASNPSPTPPPTLLLHLPPPAPPTGGMVQ